MHCRAASQLPFQGLAGSSGLGTLRHRLLRIAERRLRRMPIRLERTGEKQFARLESDKGERGHDRAAYNKKLLPLCSIMEQGVLD